MKLYLFMVMEGSICTLLYLFFNKAFPYELSLKKRQSFLRGNMLLYLLPMPFIVSRLAGILQVLLERWGIGEGPDERLEAQGLQTAGGEPLLFRPHSFWSGMIVQNKYRQLICLTGFQRQLPLVFVLLGVFALCLIGWLTVYLTLSRWYRRDVVYEGEERRGKRHIRIGRSPHISTPVTIGILRPVILFPMEEISEASGRGIVSHEVEHVRNRDNVFRLISWLTVAFAWYNPLTWYLMREHVAVSEMLCDEAAVAGMEKHEKADYMRSILDAVGRSRAPETVVMNLGKTRKLTGRRLEKIMKRNQKKLWERNLAGVILVISFLMSGIPAYAYREPVVVQDTVVKSLDSEAWEMIDWVGFMPLDEDSPAATYVLFDDLFRISFEEYGRKTWFLDEVISGEQNCLLQGCNHQYITGVYSVHVPRADGGCRVIVYHAVRCGKCGRIEKGKEASALRYGECTHE